MQFLTKLIEMTEQIPNKTLIFEVFVAGSDIFSLFENLKAVVTRSLPFLVSMKELALSEFCLSSKEVD